MRRDGSSLTGYYSATDDWERVFDAGHEAGVQQERKRQTRDAAEATRIGDLLMEALDIATTPREG